MIVLYEHPLSPYAQKVKIALREKRIDFEPRMPDLFSGGEAEFEAANPRREVPALVDGDTAVFDSTIILEYLEDRWPEPALLPTGAAARARVRMLEELCDTYYEAINWAVFEVRVFQRAAGALAHELLERAAGQVAGANAYLDRQLGQQPFCTRRPRADTLPPRARRWPPGSTGCGRGPASHRPSTRPSTRSAVSKCCRSSCVPGTSCASIAITASSGCCAAAGSTSSSRGCSARTSGSRTS
jgi:glutathione S-transferase